MVPHLLLVIAITGAMLFPQLSFSQPRPTFRNPLFTSQDPYVVYWQGLYYYSDSDGRQIFLRKSSTLSELGKQQPQVIWTGDNRATGHTNVWAPELHLVNGRWYMYFAADHREDRRHRLYVLEGGPDPFGPYTLGKTSAANGQLVESTGRWAIDPNVFVGVDQALYLTWSCTEDEIGQASQSICLARMSDPLHVSGTTVRISSPEEKWEKRSHPIQEGPFAFVRGGVTYITYSASASWTTNDYAVGVLENRSGNLLDPAAWVKKGPIFDHHGNTYGPGSLALVTSPDGTEVWSLFHAYDKVTCGQWACRSIRMQKVAWEDNGSPLLAYPADPDVPLFVPSGDVGSRTGWGDSRSGTPSGGKWRYESSSSLEVDDDANSTGRARTFRGDSNMLAWTVSAEVEQRGGTSRELAEYGLYALYHDSDNYVEASISPNAGVFISNARVAGTQQKSHCHRLPDGFNPRAKHTIAVQKSAARVFSFFLDGRPVEQRSFALDRGQVGIFAAGTGAQFEKAAVSNLSFGWDRAPGATAGDGPEQLTGAQQGTWNISDATTVSTAGDGTGRSTLYQGNPNRSDYRLEVESRFLAAAESSERPRYGVILCFQDFNDRATLWIDPVHKSLTLDSVIAGETDCDSLSLGESFDPAEYHHVTTTKAGEHFTIWLDGLKVLERDLRLSTGTAGVVTDDARAEFRNFRSWYLSETGSLPH